MAPPEEPPSWLKEPMDKPPSPRTGDIQASLPEEQRPQKKCCTDFLYFFVLVLAWVAMTAIGGEAVSSVTTLNILDHGHDYTGRLCGTDSGVESKEFLYYIDDSEDYYGVCISQCPTSTNHSVIFCVDEANIPNTTVSVAEMVEQGYCQYQLESYAVLHRCVWANATAAAAAPNPHATAGALQEALADAWVARKVVLGAGLGLALGLALLYLVVVHLPGFVLALVWASIFAVFFLLAVLGMAAFSHAYMWERDMRHEGSEMHSQDTIYGLKAFAIVCWILAFLFLCYTISQHSHISKAVVLVKESVRAFFALKFLLVFPFIKFAGFAAFLVVWCAYALCVACGGSLARAEAANGLEVWTFEYDGAANMAKIIFLLFMFVWTSQFIVAFGQITIAKAVYQWYVGDDGPCAVLCSLLSTIFCHVGTAACGALAVPLFKIPRALFMWMEEKGERRDPGRRSFLRTYCCCLRCCIDCTNGFLKYLHKQAYIQAAVHGCDFWPAAREAYEVLARSPGLVRAVHSVEHLVLLLAQLLVAVAATLAGYLLLDQYYGDAVSTLAAPCALVFVLALTTAHLFSETLGMVVHTLLQCYLMDLPEGRHADKHPQLYDSLAALSDDAFDSLARNDVEARGGRT